MGRYFASGSAGYHRRRWWQTHGDWVISSQNGRPMTRLLIEIKSTNLQHFVGKDFATMWTYCSSANLHPPELACVDPVPPSFLFYLLVDLLNKSFCSPSPIYLCIYSIPISVETLDSYFTKLVIIHYLFILMLKFSQLDQWEAIQQAPPLFWFFDHSPCFLAQQDIPGPRCSLPVPARYVAFSPSRTPYFKRLSIDLMVSRPKSVTQIC